MSSRRPRSCLVVSLLAWSVILMASDESELGAQVKYEKPPKEILEILQVPPAPGLLLSPTREYALLLQGERYPAVADLAAPMLRLAGQRINPRTNGPHGEPRMVGLGLMRISDGQQIEVNTPKGHNIQRVLWSPDGRRFAFTVTREEAGAIELWVGEVVSGKTWALPAAKHRVNAAYGEPLQWLPDSKTILFQAVLEEKERGPIPTPPRVPLGPTVQESSGKPAPVRTFQDLLRNPHDESLFDYYCTSQLMALDTDTHKLRKVGRPGIIRSADPSPDGKYLLVTRTVRPYSYQVPAHAFAREVEIWDRKGALVHKLASLPLADSVPIEGVPTGPRLIHWKPTDPATLVWVEALDDGDPKKKVPHRDLLVQLGANFKGSPKRWHLLQHRFAGINWVEDGSAFVHEYDRDRKWRRTFFLANGQQEAGEACRLVWDLSIHDRYHSPGQLAHRTLPNGQRVVRLHEGQVFLLGEGATPRGDRPFLDRMDLKFFKTKRLFQCAEKCYEQVVALVAEDASRVITRHETPDEPPNFFLRTLHGGKKEKRALTSFPDPAPRLRHIKKELVTYKRADGVELSFTLYLPPGYKKGTRLPAVLWAYPREFVDARTAGQVSGSPYRFTAITGPSHLFFLLQGYAILDGATMPVVGDPETANNTFIEQIVSSAKAAIDKAEEMGVIDRRRVGVGGHSYGAFMTANLLAHSDLFRAGIARSGAYNRTLTPFGFQSERRTLWEAPQVYLQLSPFMHAHKIKAPLLLIHGEADNNPGTFPMQSERLFHAIRGNGGVVRYVTLPHESHGYQARESVEHCLYEMLTWFDRYVKNAR